MFVLKLLQIVLAVVGAFSSLIFLYALFDAFQGDDSAPAAAGFFGIVAAVSIALTALFHWLTGRADAASARSARKTSARSARETSARPVRKTSGGPARKVEASAGSPSGWMGRIPRPRWGHRTAGLVSGVVAVSTMDGAGLLGVVTGLGDDDDERSTDWLAEELLAERHMRALGFPDARLTEPRQGDRADIVAEAAVARVTTQAEPVATPIVRRLHATSPELAAHVLYATAGFTPIGTATADKIGVSLFHITRNGTVEPANESARQMLG
ncbi:hypothetical protein [Actinoplanes couchii]|uniref:Restriction endonuclease type IV Mrr domain-containing protein n=1 Tax=Actinoplanes couchii TaxID=403638 RepID=A0ABQ3X2B2_9ACTN|nr:hypothetical protein [Actinoplanes couchii]MDR6316999.1 hypothetical protein [Actinoplanes couchii]GID52607.1 hypothetical protein Aco03nite_010110 [Actinoplanes couchii]